jgi:hypothetical protein
LSSKPNKKELPGQLHSHFLSLCFLYLIHNSLTSEMQRLQISGSIMTVLEDSLTALRNLFSPTAALPEDFRPLQSAVPTSPLSPREPKAGATANLGFDLLEEQHFQTFFVKATQPDGTISLPPYIPMMIESADHLAATALKSNALCRSRLQSGNFQVLLPF